MVRYALASFFFFTRWQILSSLHIFLSCARKGTIVAICSLFMITKKIQLMARLDSTIIEAYLSTYTWDLCALVQATWMQKQTPYLKKRKKLSLFPTYNVYGAIGFAHFSPLGSSSNPQTFDTCRCSWSMTIEAFGSRKKNSSAMRRLENAPREREIVPFHFEAIVRRDSLEEKRKKK